MDNQSPALDTHPEHATPSSATPPSPSKGRNWKKWIVIGGIVLVILLTGTAYVLSQQRIKSNVAVSPSPTVSQAASPTPFSTADWKTYKDIYLGGLFSIQHPSDWKAEYHVNNNKYVNLESPNFRINNGISIAITVSDVEQQNIDEWFTDNQSERVKSGLGLYEDEKDMLVGGVKAVQYKGGLQIPSTETAFIRNGKLFRFAMITETPLRKERLHTFNQVLSTFKFTEHEACTTAESQTPWVRKDSGSWNISYPSNWILNKYSFSVDGGLYLDGCYKGNYYVISGNYPLGVYDSLNAWVNEVIIDKLPVDQKSTVKIVDTTVAGAPAKKVLNVSKIGSTDLLDRSHHLYIWQKGDRNQRVVSIQQTMGEPNTQQMEELLNIFAEGIR